MTTYWLVEHDADLTETGQLMKRTYIRAQWVGHPAQNATKLLIENWCEQQFGHVGFVQGVAAVSTYSVQEIDEERWNRAKPINWGRWLTRTMRMTVHVGTKSGSDPIFKEIESEQVNP